MSDRDLQNQQRAQRPRDPQSPIRMATVLEVEPGDGTEGTAYATIERDDGVVTTIPPSGGFLPAVGDTLMMVANGADFVHYGTRHMIDGDLQSRTFVEGVSGWRITAEGDAELNSAKVRGEVTAERFTTEDPAGGGRIEIDTNEYGFSTIAFPHPDNLDEVTPATVGSDFDDLSGMAVFSMASMAGSDGRQAMVQARAVAGSTASLNLIGPDDVAIWSEDGQVRILAGGSFLGGQTALEVIDGDILADGVSLMDPPTFHAGRTTTQTLAVGVWTALTHVTVHHASDFTVVSGNRYRADQPGRYRVSATVEWSGGSYWAGTRISKNGTGIGGGFVASSANFRGVGHTVDNAILGASQCAVETFDLNGTTDYLQVAGYSSVASEDATMVDVLIERIGPL